MTREQWARFVALGDSFTEGMSDERGDGTYRGWADRVAEVLSAANPEFRYANLAIRGRLFKGVVNEQVPSTLAMLGRQRSAEAGAGPDDRTLVSFAAGGNDVLRPGFDLPTIERRLNWVVEQLRETGASVVLLTAADVTFLLPARRVIGRRAEAYNDVIRRTAARHGAILVDLWPDRGFVDRRMWSLDRLHLSSAGHRRAAARVLDALGTPVDPDWLAELPVAPPRAWLSHRGDDLRWARRYFAPWIARRLTGRSSGDKITPKRPTLDAVRSPLD